MDLKRFSLSRTASASLGNSLTAAGPSHASSKSTSLSSMAQTEKPQLSPDGSPPSASNSISSSVLYVFRAQGPPFSLQLPLTNTSVVQSFTGKAVESDYEVRSLASSLGLLQNFGPQPSIRMLVDDIQSLAFAKHVSATLHQSTIFLSCNFEEDMDFTSPRLTEGTLVKLSLGVVCRLTFDDSPSPGGSPREQLTYCSL